MRTRTNLAIDALLLAVYVIAANPAMTGISVHEWIGIGFGLVTAVHLIRHRDWIVRTLRGLSARVARHSKIDLAADAALLVAGGATVVTGLAISHVALPLVGITTTSGGVWATAHAISAYGLVATVLAHAALHRRWIAKAARLHVLEPLGIAFESAKQPALLAKVTAVAISGLLAVVVVSLALAGTGATASASSASYGASASGGTTYVTGSTGALTASVSSSGLLTCPRTGCTATSCHATSGGGAPGR